MRRRLSQGIRALCFTLLSSPMRRQPPPAHGCGSTHCRTPPRPRWALVAPRSKGPVVRTRGGRDRAVKKIPRPRRSRHSSVMSLQRLAGILRLPSQKPEKRRPDRPARPILRGGVRRPARLLFRRQRAGRGIAMRPWGNPGFRVFFTQRAVAVQVGLGREGDGDRCARHYQGYPVQRAKGKK